MRLRLVRAGLSALLLLLPALVHALPVSQLSRDRVGALCFDGPTATHGVNRTTNMALDCWLTQHPDVAAAMLYQDSTTSGGGVSWPDWPVPVKRQMRRSFNKMVAWYHAGMPSQIPHPFAIPIPAGGPLQPATPTTAPEFWMTEATGKRVYLSQVANTLAAELTAAFSWTITTYTSDELRLLLRIFDSMYYNSTSATPGYFFQAGGPSPATPAYTVKFFRTNDLIGTDATDTVARLFQWERQLVHFFKLGNDPTTNIGPYFWPHYPPVPDADIIEGSVYSGPSDFGFGHFTAGCTGTQDFMKSVLRSMNIPVQRHSVSCGHATPTFPTVGLAMTHGDDPYDRLGLFTPFPGFTTPAPVEYLIPLTQLDQLFPANQSYDECTQTVGIQVANLAIQYGSDYLMDFYCQDLASGADHASGQVFNYIKWYYPSLQTLESMGLWTTLDNKVTATNFCGM